MLSCALRGVFGCFSNKACLLSKQGFVYNANKASLQCKEALFENEAIVLL